MSGYRDPQTITTRAGLRPAAGLQAGPSCNAAGLLLLLPLLLTACVSQPQTYAPPIQREPVLDGQAPRPPKHILQMSDHETDAYIVKDIPRGSSDAWRWTGKRPTVRMYVADTNGHKLVVDYSIAAATLKDTGPVTLTFYVNDQPLASVTETRDGVKHFEKDIPPEMLKPSADNLFAIEIDKVWTAKEDGAKLGFILASIGLSDQTPASAKH